MNRLNIRQVIKYTTLGSIVGGTFLSLKANDYQLNSIGIVRLSRAAVTVFDIGATYNKNLYKSGISKESPEYKSLKSFCHQQAAEKLLELCCINKGVYIKVGQHIAALDYLLPKEYVQTMKILHSHAPANKLEDVYKVIREDLKQEVSCITYDLENNLKMSLFETCYGSRISQTGFYIILNFHYRNVNLCIRL